MSRSVAKRIGGLGAYLLVLFIVLIWLLVAFWPTPAATDAPPVATDAAQWQTDETLLWWKFSLDAETRLFLLVLIVAALGGYVHAGTSFATYVGNRSFADSWTWWYILRPLIAMALAAVFYCVVRGGLLALANGSEDPGDRMARLYTMAGLAGLVGLCSKQAGDKLQEIFASILRTPKGEGDDARKDKLGEQLPVSQIMITLREIVKIQLTPDRGEDQIKLAELYDLLKGPVTRIPVLAAGGAAKYIIHESTLFKFIADSVAANKKPNLANLTLEDFLNENENRTCVSQSMAFVPAEARLHEAQAAMREKANCRDVFVTENGKAEEPVQGWLTNIDIQRHCRV